MANDLRFEKSNQAFSVGQSWTLASFLCLGAHWRQRDRSNKVAGIFASKAGRSRACKKRATLRKDLSVALSIPH
jgi:hypothetical protein